MQQEQIPEEALLDTRDLEEGVRRALSPTEWLSAGDVAQAIGAALERVCNTLVKLESEGVVVSRENLKDVYLWKLTGGSRGMPVESLPTGPKISADGAAEPIPA